MTAMVIKHLNSIKIETALGKGVDKQRDNLKNDRLPQLIIYKWQKKIELSLPS